MKKRFIIFILLLMRLPVIAAESPRMYYMASSTIYARSISMGGAFTAMPGGLENALFNPAAMGINSQHGKSFSFYMNPVGGAAAVAQRSELTSRPEKQPSDWLGAAGLFARAFSFSKPFFQLTLLLSEELPYNPLQLDEHRTLSAAGHLDWHYHTLATRITLAKQVSLGATGYVFNLMSENGELQQTYGSSYGILMRPSDKLSAGVSYFNFPERADSLMFLQHRISNKSMNIGVAYQPYTKVRLALDFRNVSEENNNSTNEAHIGLELNPTRFLALRSGYYYQNSEKTSTVTCGFGFADFRTFASQTDHFVFSNIILNYGLQAEMRQRDVELVHYLTFLLRF